MLIFQNYNTTIHNKPYCHINGRQLVKIGENLEEAKKLYFKTPKINKINKTLEINEILYSVQHVMSSISNPSNSYLVIDYCSFGNDSCEHECVSVLKGFHCRCNDGYTLNDDKKTCTS